MIDLSWDDLQRTEREESILDQSRYGLAGMRVAAYFRGVGSLWPQKHTTFRKSGDWGKPRRTTVKMRSRDLSPVASGHHSFHDGNIDSEQC